MRLILLLLILLPGIGIAQAITKIDGVDPLKVSQVDGIPAAVIQKARGGALGGYDPNWWKMDGDSCLAAWCPKHAETYNASLQDLTGNGNTAYAGNDPSFTSGVGWQFDGVADHLYLPIKYRNINGGDRYTVVIRYANAVITGTYEPLLNSGVTTSSEYNLVLKYSTSGRFFRMFGGSGTEAGNAPASAVYANSAQFWYQDGTHVKNAGSYGGPAADDLALCRWQSSHYLQADIIAIAIYKTPLDATEIGIITERMEEL